jgi:hypothetical protein
MKGEGVYISVSLYIEIGHYKMLARSTYESLLEYSVQGRYHA